MHPDCEPVRSQCLIPSAPPAKPAAPRLADGRFFFSSCWTTGTDSTGIFRALGEYRYYPDGVPEKIPAAAPGLPVLLPRPFVRGVDIAMNAGEADRPSYFLAGELSKTGW